WMAATGQPLPAAAQTNQTTQPTEASPAGQVRRLLDLELYESALLRLGSAADTQLAPADRQRLLVAAVEGLADDHLICGNRAQAARRYRWLIDQPDQAAGRRVQQWRARHSAATATDGPTGLDGAPLVDRRRGRWTVVLPGPWRRRDAGRFLIHHHNDFVARRITSALDFHFAELCNYLALDPESVDWPEPVNVYVHADASALRKAVPAAGRALGRSVIGLRQTKPVQLDLHLTQDAPLLLSSILPHELAHLLIAHAVAYRPLPRHLDEGLALQFEPPAVQRRYDRLEAAQAQPAVPALKTLLQTSDRRPGLDERQYTQARLLADFLIDRLGLPKLLETCKDPGPRPAHLVNAGPWTRLDALQRDWRAYWRHRHENQP
ncbi:MAG: hypothetical protein ACE5GE_13910, partial [Phycisphaerae bacterium]